MVLFSLLKRVVQLGVLLAVLGLGGLYYWATQPLTLPTESVDFRVPPGSSVRAALRQMNAAGLNLQPELARLGIRLLGAGGQIKAGAYEVKQGATPLDVLTMLKNGDVALVELRFPEGWTFWQWKQYLAKQPGITHSLAGLSDRDILQKIGATESHPEGLFFPDTYKVDKLSSDLELLTRAYRLGQEQLSKAWAQRADGLPYKTPYEALIMASIVEKETGSPADRTRVAAVFVNRLKIGMRLQTDPTVIYGLGQRFDGNLRKKDLLADTPYNSYTRAGLPPSPIAMPGTASIQAALHPAPEEVFYFVARGDGSSQFSRTLDEHNQAVVRYQLKR